MDFSDLTTTTIELMAIVLVAALTLPSLLQLIRMRRVRRALGKLYSHFVLTTDEKNRRRGGK